MKEADIVTLIGHKLAVSKGVADMYVRPGYLAKRGRWETGVYWSAGALLLGRGKEEGKRVGTKNELYIVGIGRSTGLLTSKNNWRDNAA